MAKKLGEHSKIVRLANKLRSFYGHAVFLVGSALEVEDFKSCRDIDLVCIIPDNEFAIRYAFDTYNMLDNQKAKEIVEQFVFAFNEGILNELNSASFWRWSDDMLKKNLTAMRFTGMNIDFKVQPQSLVDLLHANKSKEKIDSRL